MTRAKRTARPGAAMVLSVALAAAVGLASTGCSIRTQAPIKEVAYDFSDRDFYDRAYAPSPKYAQMEPTYVDLEPTREGAPAGQPGARVPSQLREALAATMSPPPGAAVIDTAKAAQRGTR